MFRAIPGFAFDTRLLGLSPEIEFAIDGVRLLGQTGETAAVGDNLAAAQVMLTKENAESLVAAFATAKKQIAIIRERMLRSGFTLFGQKLWTEGEDFICRLRPD